MSNLHCNFQHWIIDHSTYEDPEKAAAEPTEARTIAAQNFIVSSTMFDNSRRYENTDLSTTTHEGRHPKSSDDALRLNATDVSYPTGISVDSSTTNHFSSPPRHFHLHLGTSAQLVRTYFIFYHFCDFPCRRRQMKRHTSWLVEVVDNLTDH
jgi:hypothetical protein